MVEKYDWVSGGEIKFSHLKKVKKPEFKSGLTHQFDIKIDGKVYPVWQSERSYAIGKQQAGYIKITDSSGKEVWYKLPFGWTSKVLNH